MNSPMKKRAALAAVALAAIAACGGGDTPTVDADPPTGPTPVEQVESSRSPGYAGRAGDVASQLDDRNAGLEELAP